MNFCESLLELIRSASTDNTVIMMIVSVVLLVLGFLGLIKGADIFVDGASKLAAKMNVPLIVIGLTIVAFGTSAPEAAISITSAAAGTAGIAVGNVIGSNIMNILLILGISAIFAKLPTKKTTLFIEIPFVVAISVLLLVLGIIGGDINRIDGFIFIVVFALFFVYLIKLAKKGNNDAVEDVPVLTKKDSLPKMILFIIVGLVLIVLGSDFTVASATEIAQTLGVSDRIIGLTIVAFGTSLPELVTCIQAARKGKTDIAVGNIIGSNIFNILFVVGLAGVVSPKPIIFESAFIFDAVIAIAAAVILFLCTVKNKSVGKFGGITMLVCYAIYFVSLIIKV